MPENTSDQEIHAVASALTNAWNAHDSAAFARAFTEDADFVNIFAMHNVGRAQIGGLHQMIFDSIYRGSTSAFTLEKTRRAGNDAIVALIRAELTVPQGPLVGTVRTLATAVLVRDGGAWKIASFQNTREQEPPPLDSSLAASITDA
jgi:uncharacterized protein (TIGR02246 family)